MVYLCKADYEVGPIDGTCASSWIPSKPYTLTKAALNLSTEGQLRNQEYSYSSTQSTDHQSCNIQGEASVGVTKFDGQSNLNINSGTGDLSMHPIYKQSFAMHRLPYVDPYYCGVPASYQQNVTTIGFSHPRVALPDLRQGKPIYVNPKRYNAILRRRQSRAKFEAQNKLAKGRKTYLHESRHAHTTKRARGPGGRFLNRKNLEDYESTSIPNNNNKPSVFNTENTAQHHALDSQLYPPAFSAVTSDTPVGENTYMSNATEPRWEVVSITRLR